MRNALALTIAGVFVSMATAIGASAAPETNRVKVSYVSPKDPRHQPLYYLLKERRALEKLQVFLSPFRLPRTLKVVLAECDGEADAFYGDDTVTICYEYFEALRTKMPTETTPAGVAPIDTIVGPFIDTSLHEFAHALFDMLRLPVLGREEDAADQVAAYIYLQLGLSEVRRQIMGTVYAFYSEARDAVRPRSLVEFAEIHSTPAQRAYNLMCMAYGAEPEKFKDFVAKGHLPPNRAETCKEEYEQVQDAFEALITPHIDTALADKIYSRDWLGETKTLRQRLRDSTSTKQAQ